MAFIQLVGPRAPSDIVVEDLQFQVSQLQLSISELETEIIGLNAVIDPQMVNIFFQDDNWGAAINENPLPTDYALDDNWAPNIDVTQESNFANDDVWTPILI